MIYFADLHVHSRFSRATSRDCNLVELARWAARKGILVLATGDFTHPEWSAEIREMLDEAEEGLFRLKKEFASQDERLPGGFSPRSVRFILNVEISSIYKKHGSVRKVHNLVFMPDLESMDRFNHALSRIGNLKSDGRPILGLDSRDLLEIALEAGSDSFLIPAHVWTPWFSILGSKSGFDSVEECFGDLAEHVFALETGLSSDPEMNHRVSSLDRYTLVSNSDTHSPGNLAREANIFEGNPGYLAIREALRIGGGKYRAIEGAPTPMESVERRLTTGEQPGHGAAGQSTRLVDSLTLGEPGFIGTVEFFPEEGKYHLDGHRKCSVRLDPEETAELDGICPVCGKQVTVGVMNRVVELGDRSQGAGPQRAAPFWRMLPLPEIVAQSLGVGRQSKKVRAAYMDLLGKLGPELTVLWSMPLDEIARHAPKIIVEGIARVRRSEVSILGGFDGEYGTVQLFTNQERDELSGQQSLIPLDRPAQGRTSATTRSAQRKRPVQNVGPADEPEKTDLTLNHEQLTAVNEPDGPIVVQAGPGTGKTRTLTQRIVRLLDGGKVAGKEITAVTFTRKASQEIRDRLKAQLKGRKTEECWVGTFHQLGARILEHFGSQGAYPSWERTLDEVEAVALFRQTVKDKGLKIRPQSIASFYSRVSLLKQRHVMPDNLDSSSDLGPAYATYEEALFKARALDLDDLVCKPVQLLNEYPSEAATISETMGAHLLVDEFQDVNKAQYKLVRLLAGEHGKGLFVIGDPNQAIYGFRGSDWRFFRKLSEDFSSVKEIRLTHNYRSQENILKAAGGLINDMGNSGLLEARVPGKSPVRVVELPNAATEGTFVTKTIDSMLGGSSFFSLDSRASLAPDAKLGFRDFAVLYRLNAVGDSIEKAFQASGIPFQRARRNDPKSESESLDPRAQAVTLMTIHASKGLEFPVVFVAGCEDGIIPASKESASEPEQADIDEERRLLYVAMTRAEMELFITRARSRLLFGRKLENPPSRFLESIDPTVCEYSFPLKDRKPKPEAGPVQCELFE